MTILLALISSVVWGTSDFIGGLISRRLPTYLVVVTSQAAGLAAVTVPALVTGGFRGQHDWVVPAMIAGSSLAVGLLMFYTALATGPMGIVSPITALAVLVPVGVGVAQGDSLSATTSAGIVVAMAGAVSASGPELRGAVHAKPILLAALSAMCFGVATLFLAQGAKADPLMSLWGMRAISVVGLVVGILFIATRRPVSAVTMRPRDVSMILLAGLGDSTANLLFQLASLRGYLSVVSVLASLYPAMTVLLARVVLQQRLGRLQLVGIAATLGGVALVSAG
jgi:drug/metabolite transporter (DMT)-like permease